MDSDLFPVAILAGGLATRLRPITETNPKSMVDINGEPFIAHQLRLLSQRGIARVVICVGYLGEKIEKFVREGSRFGLHAEFSYDGPRLLGTAGAIKKALPLLGENFFILYGDSYLPCDYRRVQEAFQLSGCPALMTVFRNEGQWDKSNVEFLGGRIRVYDKQHKTPRMHHIDYGLGVFHRDVFISLPDDQPYDLAALYRELLRQGKLAGHEMKERFYEIGSFEGIEELRRLLANNRSGPTGG